MPQRLTTMGSKQHYYPCSKTTLQPFLKSPSSFHPQNTSQIISLRDKAFYFNKFATEGCINTCPCQGKLPCARVGCQIFSLSSFRNGNWLFYFGINQTATPISLKKQTLKFSRVPDLLVWALCRILPDSLVCVFCWHQRDQYVWISSVRMVNTLNQY